MRDFTEGRTGKLMTDELQYDVMVERALRGVMVEALTLAAEHGLPGNHHFYVTFKTEAPGVNIPTHLAERYPDEMTIVLQFQYWDLEISDEGLGGHTQLQRRARALDRAVRRGYWLRRPVG